MFIAGFARRSQNSAVQAQGHGAVLSIDMQVLHHDRDTVTDMVLLSDIVDVLVCGQRSGTDAGLNTQSLCNHIVGTGGQDRRSGAATVLDIGIATEEVAVTLNLHCI